MRTSHLDANELNNHKMSTRRANTADDVNQKRHNALRHGYKIYNMTRRVLLK